MKGLTASFFVPLLRNKIFATRTGHLWQPVIPLKTVCTAGQAQYCPGFLWVTTRAEAVAPWIAGAVLPLFLCEARLRTPVVGSMAPNPKAPAWLAHSKVLSTNSANLFRTVLRQASRGAQTAFSSSRGHRRCMTIPSEPHETRNPGVPDWIPACLGNDRLGKSTSTLSGSCYKRLRRIFSVNPWVKLPR
jgi:hypothetical protein